MPYNEFKLTRTTPSQLRGVQESYYYDANDETLSEVLAAGYFTGFPCNDDCETIVTVNASDGWANIHPDGDGGASETVNALIGDKTAQEVSDAAEKVLKPNITRPTSIALCGDSITDDSHSSNQWTDWGWGAWFRRSLNKNYSVDSFDIFATASMGTVHLLSTQLPALISSGCGVCVTMIGTNDLGSDVDIIANLDTFYNELENNNIIAIAMPILPRDDMTAATSAQASQINKWLYNRAQIKSTMYYIATLDTMTDYTTYNGKAGYLRDGLHTTKVGAKALGEFVSQQFNNLFSGPSALGYAVRGNQYDATENPNGNLVPNPYMTGTNGTLQNGATGQAASDIAVRRSAPGATFGMAASKETINDTDYQVITLSGTGDSNVATGEFYIGTVPASWVEGDTLEGGMSLIAEGIQGVGYFAVSVWAGGSTSYDGAVSAANGVFPSDITADYKAKVVIPASATSIRVRIDAATENGSPLAGTIKFSKAFIEKVS